MKLHETFEGFLNEGIQFGKKGILNKLKQKLELAKEAAKKWGGGYEQSVKDVEGYIKNPKSLDWDNHNLIGGSEKQESYEVFMEEHLNLSEDKKSGFITLFAQCRLIFSIITRGC